MSHAHSHENTVPRPALWLAGGLVGFSLLMTASVTMGLFDREAVPQITRMEANVAPVEVRELRFADRADGAVLITEADSGATVAVVETETEGGGFIRGVLRGLARERRMYGVGSSPPFTLTLWQDGSISLVDSATGRNVELGAFGPDNRATFVALLDLGGAS